MGFIKALPSKTGSGAQNRRAYRPMAEINVTPFVDVMLVLLIVFMISAPLLTAGVQVDLPESDAPPINRQETKPIEITISDDGLFIGSTEVKRSRLIDLLKAMSDGDTGRRIYIRGAEKLTYGRVMEIIGAINAAGFNKVALISEPDTGQ